MLACRLMKTKFQLSVDGGCTLDFGRGKEGMFDQRFALTVCERSLPLPESLLPVPAHSCGVVPSPLRAQPHHSTLSNLYIFTFLP